MLQKSKILVAEKVKEKENNYENKIINNG